MGRAEAAAVSCRHLNATPSQPLLLKSVSCSNMNNLAITRKQALMAAAGTTPFRATASPPRGNGRFLQVPPPLPLAQQLLPAATMCCQSPPLPPSVAGIAAVRGPSSSPPLPLIHVLSCCTGTKCIGRSRLQVRRGGCGCVKLACCCRWFELLCWLTRCKGCGSLLHDSHAEVIARRNMLLVMLLRE
jgi:hypothetical protein